MGYHKEYNGLSELPEVKEIIEVLRARKYSLEWCNDYGLKMQKMYTEVHFIPETDRLRVFIHDDGMVVPETDKALKIAEIIFLKYEYKKGEDIHDGKGGYIESKQCMYKYF
jgi:hypothetical protein